MSASPRLTTLRYAARAGCAVLHQAGRSVCLVVDPTLDLKAGHATGTVKELECSSAGFARAVYERAGAAMKEGAPVALVTVWHQALYLDAMRAHAHRRQGRRPYTRDISVQAPPELST